MKQLQAFPVSYNGRDGMTLRDYFAAKVVQALAANQAWSEESIAEAAYRQADAMLKAREE